MTAAVIALYGLRMITSLSLSLPVAFSMADNSEDLFAIAWGHGMMRCTMIRLRF
jgi:hypothetical protein